MAPPLTVAEVALELAPWQQLQPLLDSCYPWPPQNVFERVVAVSQHRHRLWQTIDGDGLLGLMMLSPHSKAGSSENLAVAPTARGRNIGQQLGQSLLQVVCQESSVMVSLTTRIPSFFAPFGFQPFGKLAEGSTAMTLLLPSPAISEPPIP